MRPVLVLLRLPGQRRVGALGAAPLGPTQPPSLCTQLLKFEDMRYELSEWRAWRHCYKEEPGYFVMRPRGTANLQALEDEEGA